MRNLQLDHAGHRPADAPLKLRLLAHDIHIALNVGALFRVADAFGFEHLHLTGSSPVPSDYRVRKAARTADRHVAHSHDADPLATVAALKAGGWRIVALERTTCSIDLRTLPAAAGERICLVVGAERSGVCQALLDVADVTVHIPMRGLNSSMNLASACAIAAYEIVGRLTT